MGDYFNKRGIFSQLLFKSGNHFHNITMAELTFSHSANALSETDINAVENLLGIKIPADVKSHYMTFNGGYPSKQVFEYEYDDEIMTATVIYFMPFCCQEGVAIEKVALDYWQKYKMPTYFLPFAWGWDSDYLVYHLESGEIYRYYIDDWSDEVRAKENFVRLSRLIANNFQEFLEGLTE